MPDYITIDGGTTNTRISLIVNNRVVDTLKYSVGAKNGIENSKILKNTIKQGIADLLNENNLTEDNIERILASGMITSEFGLVDLPHTVLPAGIGDLHNTMYQTELPDISAIPFVFMRGVKTNGLSLESADMMRGEETELMGILHGEGVYVLLGSHSKIIRLDAFGRIIDFKTMLTGEMIAALSQNTILKGTVECKNQSINKEFLHKGFVYAQQNGINNALFKVRVLKTVLNKQTDEIYSFFMGVILCDEIEYIQSLKTEQIVVTGQAQIKDAVVELLHQLSSVKVIRISKKEADEATSVGMVKIFEY